MRYNAIWDSRLTAQMATAAGLWLCPRDLHLGGSIVLDAGCGTGLFTEPLVARGVRVVSLDPSREMLALVPPGRGGASLQALGEAMPLSADSVAGVVLGAVLHVVDDPQSVAREAMRVLRPTGRMVATWPNDGLTLGGLLRAERRAQRSWHSRWRAHLLRLSVGVVGMTLRVRRHSTPQLLAALECAGRVSGVRVVNVEVANTQVVVRMVKHEWS